MNLEDFKAIEVLIDDIIGLSTKQGANIKQAIKNYFDTKPVSVKLVSKDNVNISVSPKLLKHSQEAEAAMERYTSKLKEETKKLKEKGEFCGVSGWDTWYY